MGMNELRALRQLLNDDRDDWDELVASYLALRKAVVTNRSLAQEDRDRVAEYLRKAGWHLKFDRRGGWAIADPKIRPSADPPPSSHAGPALNEKSAC
jgi:hypothetical protein